MDLLTELENLALEAENENESNILETGLVHSHRPTTQLKAQRCDYTTTYLVKLEGPLNSPSIIQQIAGLLERPLLKRGEGELGDASFCLIKGTTRLAILSAFSNYAPTFIRVNMADKHLSNYSISPSLGSDIDTTLPHNRAPSTNQIFLPTQNQYPVWYFFYGTLTDPETLARKICLPVLPVLQQATVKGGKMKMWGGKYKALIDGPSSSVVNGWAYEVNSEEEEEQLRYYETDQYEVVRCEIHIVDSGDIVKGLTFRFIDDRSRVRETISANPIADQIE
ncbi:hypothetical protein BDV35DRAFT_404315 [Aspergillus flavus]|uniref:Putative gamma-glutamylcyclotransferase n=4 Tax=Aspergillus subgen. Circumdati TaxID=2720871 RepID=Q2TWK7_ASPOR|nr:unnamed protein product [Aspergillus oryzae RIB40]EIT75664.1 hypothetical protein Ao3042_08329 [Aspergillus oryzae 3.042]KAB8252621.1 hypothetical protein BDV35DRAFT_404315 [Aspergillus flavus]KDE86114.1 hypothetical protein AO1008_03791 [Aspergillus oryzae 100-8]GMF81270.1 unnamed protein product [Aspergillus oryzae]GMG45260.1 unnamed protein product [Aspergillus oryzae var. brunneus]|eukprot:EIT75664.1 hypothetical protein Ao3042_08329 [Aspergillus oryzae 3.042]